jgi:hypothetical protein
VYRDLAQAVLVLRLAYRKAILLDVGAADAADLFGSHAAVHADQHQRVKVILLAKFGADSFQKGAELGVGPGATTRVFDAPGLCP